MEKTIRQLFDFQAYEKNTSLQSVIDAVHARYAARQLSDDEADMVFAAGQPEIASLRKDPRKKKNDETL